MSTRSCILYTPFSSYSKSVLHLIGLSLWYHPSGYRLCDGFDRVRNHSLHFHRAHTRKSDIDIQHFSDSEDYTLRCSGGTLNSPLCIEGLEDHVKPLYSWYGLRYEWKAVWLVSSDLYEDDLRKSTKELKRSSTDSPPHHLDLCITALALEWFESVTVKC